MCTDYSLFSAIVGVFMSPAHVVTLSFEMVLALNYRQLCEGFSVGSIFIWDFHNPSAVCKCITSFFSLKLCRNTQGRDLSKRFAKSSCFR